MAYLGRSSRGTSVALSWYKIYRSPSRCDGYRRVWTLFTVASYGEGKYHGLPPEKYYSRRPSYEFRKGLLYNSHMPWSFTLQIIQIVEGIDYLHNMGIVHGDIKPVWKVISLFMQKLMAQIGKHTGWSQEHGPYYRPYYGVFRTEAFDNSIGDHGKGNFQVHVTRITLVILSRYCGGWN
jgi:hypothetical protein